MESPSRALTLSKPHHSLSPTTTFTRRRNSPEFEFEFSNIGRNPHTPLLSADVLFSDGFLLPLHLLPTPLPDSAPEPGPTEPDSQPSPLITSSSNPILTASRRWREIFKRGEKKTPEKLEKRKEKERKHHPHHHHHNNNNGNINANASSLAELNINIWPFSRSWSAGNNSGRSKPSGSSNRKVSSAPCSRSNSAGESKSRRAWPNSPSRTGVHLGRASPVWQVRRNGSVNRNSGLGGSGKVRVLKFNVPVCMGYRQNLSCRSEENGGGGGGRSGGEGARSGSNGNFFSLRGLFSKKSTVVTV